MNEQLDVLVEFAFAAAVGTKRYALRDVITPTLFYEGRVFSFSGLEREISVVPGEFRLSGFGLELNNADNHFSDIRDKVPLKNVVVTLLFGDLAAGAADFTTISKGVIDTWYMDDIFAPGIISGPLSRFDENITGVITRKLFPNLPDGTPLALIPLVVGTVTSSSLFDDGAVPAYLIDPAVAQAKYQYVAARGTIKAVDTVYLYGAVVSSGFTVQQRTFGTQQITTIEFDADQRDADRSNELEITWDGQGLTDDGTPSGANIPNPSLAYKEVLLDQGFAAGELDTAGFNTARDVYIVRNVVAGIAVVDKDDTLREVAERVAESFNLTTVANLAGLISVTVPEPGATAPGATEVNESQIVAGSFGYGPSDQLANVVDYEFGKHFVADEFQDRSSVEDAPEIAAVGEVRATRQLHYCSDPTGASAMANDKLFFMAEARNVVTFLADAALFKTLTIGSKFRLTHFKGPALAGFSSALMRVIAAGLEMDDLSLVVRIRAIDLTETAADFSTDFLLFGDEQPQFLTNAVDMKHQPSGAPIIETAF